MVFGYPRSMVIGYPRSRVCVVTFCNIGYPTFQVCVVTFLQYKPKKRMQYLHYTLFKQLRKQTIEIFQHNYTNFILAKQKKVYVFSPIYTPSILV